MGSSYVHPPPPPSQSLARLLKTYDQSLKSNKLSEEMCRRYLDTLETFGHAQDALTASSLATVLYPESVELWQRRLSIVAVAGEGGGGGVRTRRSKVTRKTEGGGRVGEVCREALDKVPKKVRCYSNYNWQSSPMCSKLHYTLILKGSEY